MSDTPAVRFAAGPDLDWCADIDNGLSRSILARKIDSREILLAEVEGERRGTLRLEYLWSVVPYIALIRVQPDYRRRGVGRALLTFLEARLLDDGHRMLLSSSQADEPEPQAWHRHMGFVECGILAGINAGGVGEIFFRKLLQQE